MEIITEVAVIVEDKSGVRHMYHAPKPARHMDLMDAAFDELKHLRIISEGFLTSSRLYKTREQAAAIAAAANQIISDNFNPSCLYSEDLW